MTREGWEQYWQNSDVTWFGRVCSLHRYFLIAPHLRNIMEKYFPKDGFFVDSGSGSSESAIKLKKHNRKFIALDISHTILTQAIKKPQIDFAVNADIFHLPFQDSSIDGFWNLGVMEHFDEDEIQNILKESYRSLKPGSYCLFFWPPVFGTSEIFLGSLSFVLNKVLRRNFWYTPEEKTKIRSKKHIRSLISKSPLDLVKLHFSPRDFFTYMVVVCRKPLNS